MCDFGIVRVKQKKASSKRMEGEEMERKADTPKRLYRRKYEAVHKEYRKKNHKVFATNMPRQLCEEIEEYLRKYKITKVDFIRESYNILRYGTIKK